MLKISAGAQISTQHYQSLMLIQGLLNKPLGIIVLNHRRKTEAVLNEFFACSLILRINHLVQEIRLLPVQKWY